MYICFRPANPSWLFSSDLMVTGHRVSSLDKGGILFTLNWMWAPADLQYLKWGCHGNCWCCNYSCGAFQVGILITCSTHCQSVSLAHICPCHLLRRVDSLFRSLIFWKQLKIICVVWIVNCKTRWHKVTKDGLFCFKVYLIVVNKGT